MSLVTFDLEGVEELEVALTVATEVLSLSLVDCVLDAGVACVVEMRGNHPYTDRTGKLTEGMQCKIFGRQSRWQKQALVFFTAKYAKFVNDGVPGKSRPYPFLPQGEIAGMAKLEQRCNQALTRFCKGV